MSLFAQGHGDFLPRKVHARLPQRGSYHVLLCILSRNPLLRFVLGRTFRLPPVSGSLLRRHIAGQVLTSACWRKSLVLSLLLIQLIYAAFCKGEADLLQVPILGSHMLPVCRSNFKLFLGFLL